jgi:SAM-dependent methyltransferase
MLNKVASVLTSRGVSSLLLAIAHRLAPPRARCFRLGRRLLAEKIGLEIGGPSPIFARGGLFPVYPILQRLDNCNFSQATIWEGKIDVGPTFQYDEAHAPGYQYILEATELDAIPTGVYDFVLSSHTLEHTANPLQALSEWLPVLKVHGMLVLVIPHKDGTFDHQRPVTPLEHLIYDFEHGTTEADLTHLPEILALHDLSQDPEAGDFGAFKARSEQNFENRCLHHHVFDTEAVVRLIDHVGVKIHAIEPLRPYHIFAVAEKLPEGQLPQNQIFLADRAKYSRSSPFPSDKKRTGYTVASAGV